MSRRDQQPVAIDALEKFDHATRHAALQLVHEKLLNGPPHLYKFALDDMLALAGDDRCQVLDCLVAMAAAAFLEYYGGWDSESAARTIVREMLLAEDLTDPPADGR